MKYSKADITQWLLGAFKVKSMQGNELNFPCPICDHESCYFNVQKQTGYCHRDSCHEIFDVKRLIDIIGSTPELAGYVPALYVPKLIPPRELKLPEDARPIERGDVATTILGTRGVHWDMIKKFNIHQTERRIIVPIYEDGVLVQYNSRRIKRNIPVGGSYFDAGPKPYKYASGYSITNYFLGWDECKLWDKIVLVENTFVSMWLRDLNCTATFGSHLSDMHVHKLVHSNIDHVTILWDGPDDRGKGGANPGKARRNLRAAGVPCKVINILGQPDDYPKDTIQEILDER